MTKAKITQSSICSNLATTCERLKKDENPLMSIVESCNMNVEVESAVSFFTCLLIKAKFSFENTSMFRNILTILLKEHYKGHWYPNEPMKGCGYRCLRVNGVMHPILVKAATTCKLSLKQMRQAFPCELTVWVDPSYVSVRFGEEGSIGILYSKLNEPNDSNCNAGTKRVLLMLADRTVPIWLNAEKTKEANNWRASTSCWNDSSWKPIQADPADMMMVRSPFKQWRSKSGNVFKGKLSGGCRMECQLRENVHSSMASKDMSAITTTADHTEMEKDY